MKFFGRKSELEKRLISARKDYDAALVKLEAILARKNSAAETTDAFSAWKIEYDAASVELNRRETLIDAISEGAEALKAHEEAEALKARIEAARKLNVDLANKMTTDGVKMVSDILKLVAAVSAAEVEANAVNRLLPDGEVAVPSANFLARGTPAVPREVLSESVVRLWAFASTGQQVGDQSAVIPSNNDPETGVLSAGATVAGVACVKRDFQRVDFYPGEPPAIPEHLHSTMRLPHFDRSGIAVDGSRLIVEDAATISTDPPKREVPKPRERRIKQDFTPIGPMPDFKTAIQLEHERLLEERQ